MPPRKSESDPPLRSPIDFHPPSNGEFLPRPPSPRQRLAERLWREQLERRHRRLGLSRREFSQSACGMAAALWAINQAACGSGSSDGGPRGERPTGCYGIDETMLEDEARARELLGGEEFIFDVQTHVSDPLTPFERDDPPARALDFVTELFVQSDTTVACVSGVPAARDLGAEGVGARNQLREIVERFWGPRLLLHANADPENGPSELDYMSAVADAHPVSAWKVYPHSSGLLLDADELATPFFERARSLGVRVIAAHRGISGGGGYGVPGSPRDVVRAAAGAPDMDFLVYHSGWESSHDENHPYDPDEADPQGVDRLVRALIESQIGPEGNVYAELGSTWFSLMAYPDQAAHVLGKLLRHLGSERVLWGTDAVLNSGPQSQIAALRAFEIPQAMQAEYGYPALTDEVRARIFGLNAAEVYGIDPAATRYAVQRDEISCLRAAYAADPSSLTLPDPRRYEGPRTRREFFALLARDEREKALLRSRVPG